MTEILKGCEEARVLASRELDRELDAAGLAVLEAHLASCAACRAERASLARVDALMLDGFSGHPFDERLVREIVRMAETRSATRATPAAAPRGAIIQFRAGGLVAAAAAAIVLLSVGIGLRGEGTTSQPAPATPLAVIARAHGAGLRVGNLPAPGSDAQPVHEDEMVVNQQGAGTLVLEDGTRIDLRPDTTVVLHRERDGGISVLLAPDREPSTGEVFCEVAKQKGHPFRVVTNTLSATVVGTKFLVRATGRESSVAVVEGRVRVASGTQQVLLSRDQEAVVANAQPILLTRPLADARAQLSWNRRVLETLPSPPSAPTAPINSSRPSTRPAERPPVSIDHDVDEPVTGPKKK